VLTEIYCRFKIIDYTTYSFLSLKCVYIFFGVPVYSIYYIRYNYMFRHLTMTIFRLYMKIFSSSYTELIWTVYSGRSEVRWARDLVCVTEVGRCGYMGGLL